MASHQNKKMTHLRQGLSCLQGCRLKTVVPEGSALWPSNFFLLSQPLCLFALGSAALHCLGLGYQPHAGGPAPTSAPTEDKSMWTGEEVAVLVQAAARWWLCSPPLGRERCGWSSGALTKTVEMWGKLSSLLPEDVFHLPSPGTTVTMQV